MMHLSGLFRVLLLLCCLVLASCAVHQVPAGGSGSLRLVEGGLVETLAFNGGLTLNIQVTGQDVSTDPYLYPYVLTIGSFSPVMGSGFASRADIYFESGIGEYGTDRFEAAGKGYRVGWRQLEGFPVTDSPTGVFVVTITQDSFLP